MSCRTCNQVSGSGDQGTWEICMHVHSKIKYIYNMGSQLASLTYSSRKCVNDLHAASGEKSTSTLFKLSLCKFGRFDKYFDTPGTRAYRRSKAACNRLLLHVVLKSQQTSRISLGRYSSRHSLRQSYESFRMWQIECWFVFSILQVCRNYHVSTYVLIMSIWVVLCLYSKCTVKAPMTIDV